MGAVRSWRARELQSDALLSHIQGKSYKPNTFNRQIEKLSGENELKFDKKLGHPITYKFHTNCTQYAWKLETRLSRCKIKWYYLYLLFHPQTHRSQDTPGQEAVARVMHHNLSTAKGFYVSLPDEKEVVAARKILDTRFGDRSEDEEESAEESAAINTDGETDHDDDVLMLDDDSFAGEFQFCMYKQDLFKPKYSALTSERRQTVSLIMLYSM